MAPGTVRFGGSVVALAGASAVQAALSIALLPLATLVLGAADFGTYALFMSVVALLVAVSDGGGALALPAHFGPADATARGRMVVTFVIVSGSLGVAVGLMLAALWPLKASAAPTLGIEPSAAIWLTCAALVPLRALSATASVVFSVSGRGLMIAAQLTVQALATFVASVACLFAFDLGLLSLFVGALVGQGLGLVVAACALAAHLTHRPSSRWLRVALAHAPTAAAAGLVDGARVLAENALLARATGLREVGYYAHARLYFGIGITATNAVSQNLWSISLAEARDCQRRFPRTGFVWEAVHICVVVAGFAATAFGDEIVGLITNNVLTPAADYLPWLIVLLLLNLSGRSAQATLFAAGFGAALTRVRTALALGSLSVLPVVVAEFGGVGLSLGIPGLIGVAIAEAIVYRIYLRRRAASIGTLPFQDFWVLVGGLGIAAAALLDATTHPTFAEEATAFLLATGAVLLADVTRGGPVLAIAALRWPRT
jgi:O-antigen/teichoic acid export membrane protein